MHTRRDFLKTAGLGLAAGSLLSSSSGHAQSAPDPTNAAPAAITLGVASYSLRKFKVDQALAMTQRLGISRMTFKDAHLSLKAPDEQIKQTMALAREKGIEVYACGTVYMKTEADVDEAFRYAKTAGMQMIVGAPNVALLPLVEKRVKESGVALAIHNHGPDNPLYPSPLDAFALIKNMDARMGLCMDIGHTQRLGQSPVAVFQETFDRVFDVHIKDVSGSNKAGKTCEIGRGVIDMAGFLKTVIAKKYAHTLSFEFEKDDNDPLPGMAESVGYVRGMLKLLGA
ncbi:MAG: sugar phosphate isomerase/epimerase [Opitutae bacterium]|nr:sugar phosphate isomerase/epimerase [Opitutae bacterium]